MPETLNQKAFHAGEWAPNLYARVDLAKYHSAAALLRNFFVDYRGGASSRPGTRHIIQAYKSATNVRLIPFSASFIVNYVLEVGDFYIRFHIDASTVLEANRTITAITQANPGVVTSVAHGFATGDWVFIKDVVGMTQVNGRYFRVGTTAANTFQLQTPSGAPVNTTTFGAYVSGGTAQRVYTIASPYSSDEIGLVKFAGNVNTMILCHPAHPTYILTLVSATNWTLQPIVIGATVAAPAGTAVATTLGAGAVHYSYQVTAVDDGGQESAAGTAGALANRLDITTNPGTNTITWSAVPGAVSYNIYQAMRSYTGAIPGGVSYGFMGTSFALVFNDTNIAANFGFTPPITQNPFLGASVASVTITAGGVYGIVPSATIAAPPAGHQATAAVTLQAFQVLVPAPTPNGFNVGEIMTVNGAHGGLSCVVATVDGTGKILTLQPMTFPGSNRGAISGVGVAVPTNPVVFQGSLSGFFASLDVGWAVGIVAVVSGGDGYVTAPAVTFSAGVATATAVLGASSAGNPSVPAYFAQRLVLAAPTAAPQTFNMSQPGSYFNFNVSNPIQPDDAITGTLISLQLNEIRSMIPMPGGLVILTSRQAWQVSGGSQGAAVTPIDVQAQSQAFNGASHVRPLLSNYDILYVQAKGSIVRSLSYDFYRNIYTGTDISILSSHLFTGFQIVDWDYAEEPFKLIWAVRDDGRLLSLTYLKEQEVIGWAHSDTNGLFKSVACVTEETSVGIVDATYFVVERNPGVLAVKSIERLADRIFPYGVEDSWCVDAAVQSVGLVFIGSIQASGNTVGASVTIGCTETIFSAGTVGNTIRMGGGIFLVTAFNAAVQVQATVIQAMTEVIEETGVPLLFPSGDWTIWVPSSTFTGLDHLDGYTVTGVADGIVIPPTVVVNGQITLASPATKVTIGLAFSPELQTLILDVGDPTVIGKLKKIIDVTVRGVATLGIQFGRTLETLVPIKDFSGAVDSQGVTLPYALTTADARSLIDPKWDQDGQYFIVQPLPLPATIIGVVPEFKGEDRK